MPSRDHELAIDLLRRSPRTLARILRHAFGIEVGEELVSVSEAFDEIEPSTYVADLVLTGPEATLIVEVQRQRDADKVFRWPFYVAGAHARTRRRTWLVVLAFEESVADWARRPISTFHDGTFRPIVIGPAAIPRVFDLDEARADPELAVLSTMMHGRDADALAVGLAGFVAASTVALEDKNRGRLYADAVLASLSRDDMRVLLEVVMKSESFPYKSEFARENYERGRAEGVAEGKAEGLIAVLVTLCREHGIPWTESRAANVAALDADTLERLVVRVIGERRWPDDA
ncbi:MAG: hypothetical protein J0L92_15855 [Deltaproteobacteria bacterium]|nr:hypothetical protein [Deltaproteobacteria bacterium]